MRFNPRCARIVEMSDVMEAATSMESKGGNYPHRGFQSPGRRLP